MTKTDAVAIFAEGTFEDQVRAILAVHCSLIQDVLQIAELAGYISLSRPEPERAPYVQSIREKLAEEEGQTPLSEDISRRREVFTIVFGDVKGLGEGTDRGACQCFSFLFSRLITTPQQRLKDFSTFYMPIY